MINVLEQVKPFLTFESEDDFYFLQIIQRRKDNPLMEVGTRTIKSYYISSIEYLDRKWDEIVGLSKMFNARVGLRLNKRSYKATSFRAFKLIIGYLETNQVRATKTAFDRAAGQSNNAGKAKLWIVDIDKPEEGEVSQSDVDDIRAHIDAVCLPVGMKVKLQLHTKSGFHLITKPFDVKTFKKAFPGIDIHKDNPMNVFIP